jgi:hypothetical protein
MEIAVKMAEMSSEGRGRRRWQRRRRRGGLPRRRHHGGALPLSPLPSWLHGSPPAWRWDPWGRWKRGSGGYKFVSGGVFHKLGFLPLYSPLDSRLPILGRTILSLTQPSGLGIIWILCLERLREIPYNFVVEDFSIWRCIWPVMWPSSKRVLTQISGKFQFDSNKVSNCILDNSYTSKCKTRILCTFATISRLVQINHKSVHKV